MGIVKKVAVMGAVAATGAFAAKRTSVKKALRGLIARGKDAIHDTAEKADRLATRADAALTPEANEAKSVAGGVKEKPRTKKPRAARRKARRTAHAAS